MLAPPADAGIVTLGSNEHLAWRTINFILVLRSLLMATIANDIKSKTQVMGLFAQILSGIGFALIIVGAVVLIMDLIAEFSGEDGTFELMVALESAAIMFYGMMFAALGQGLICLRSIAIHCELMASKD